MGHAKPFPLLVRPLRILQQDPIPTFCHVPLGFRVLTISAVTARLARLVLEILEPRIEPRSLRVMRVGCTDCEKSKRNHSTRESHN